MSTRVFNSPDELTTWLGTFPTVGLTAAEGAMGTTLLFLHGLIPPYPGPAPTGQTVKNMTPKARAWFFWALKQGLINLPYKRTGLLGQSFTTEVTRTTDSVMGEMGTNVAYAPWVVGPDYPGQFIHGQQMYQAKIHQGRWWEFQSEMDKGKQQAGQVFADDFFSRFVSAV